MWRAALALVLAVSMAAPAAANDTRWLACTYTKDGKKFSLSVAFDQDRNFTAIFDDGELREGTNTSITFQAIRSRFPAFFLTYNRNDGSLSLAPTGGGGFTAGLVHGECRRSNPPPGAPRG
jgi:hypothetical protein